MRVTLLGSRRSAASYQSTMPCVAVYSPSMCIFSSPSTTQPTYEDFVRKTDGQSASSEDGSHCVARVPGSLFPALKRALLLWGGGKEQNRTQVPQMPRGRSRHPSKERLAWVRSKGDSVTNPQSLLCAPQLPRAQDCITFSNAQKANAPVGT